jgi:hypothetical protein
VGETAQRAVTAPDAGLCVPKLGGPLRTTNSKSSWGHVSRSEVPNKVEALLVKLGWARGKTKRDRAGHGWLCEIIVHGAYEVGGPKGRESVLVEIRCLLDGYVAMGSARNVDSFPRRCS